MNENKEIKRQKPISSQEEKQKQIKKQKAQQQTQKFKSKYFDFYDDIKISDRQDW